ncbi:hypothetical protein AABD61_06650 [Edwardsiella piscicida]|uniref:hypothetical protein n=1 Tax=Edwardsiella piscicida TaxID=1263550 RepID=UPI00370D09D9
MLGADNDKRDHTRRHLMVPSALIDTPRVAPNPRSIRHRAALKASVYAWLADRLWDRALAGGGDPGGPHPRFRASGAAPLQRILPPLAAGA